ncbi:MAG: NAD(P)/FAD-dependent oxidoreductase [Actinomycetota bacterium]|nr:NAD(P)/FAD-dependent oxidoreductase [Actinomycetota bacterium]
MSRNPHAGEPFDDSDDAIAAALTDISVPALLCSLVHMTGDPQWIRGPIAPRIGAAFDIQCGISPEDQDRVRRAARPVISDYRDHGCQPIDLPHELLREMMEFLGRRPVDGSLAGLFFDDMQFEGGDTNAVTWGADLSESVKQRSPVVVIGAGMGGILAGIRLAQAGLPFVILEKNPGPGGTWWENSYPGARVDIGSHQYCYSFEPGDHWSEFYCQQPELRRYFISIVEKYGLASHCRFDTTVESVTWDPDRDVWVVRSTSSDGTSDVTEGRFVISAVGSLNIPRLPEIAGMDTFAGPSFHSARWPEGLDVRGRRFALIGAGASGFQIAPTIAPLVDRLTVFQRTAQWIIHNPLYHSAVPAGDRWALRHLPFYGRWYRFIMTFAGIAAGMEPYRIDPSHDDPTDHSVNETNAQRAAILLAWMKSMIADRPDLEAKVVPDYPALGKRVLQDNGSYLRCLQLPNVELVRTAIERIEPDCVVTADGSRYPADVICYATGFRHNDFIPFDVIGRNGTKLRERWRDEPTAYLGITVADFPNLFMVYGPGTNLAAGASLFYHAEFQVHYAMDAIRQTLSSGATTCEVTAEAQEEYALRYRDEIAQMVWSHPSIRHSHYKNPDGKVFTLSPWSLDRYWENTRHMERSHYVLS